MKKDNSIILTENDIEGFFVDLKPKSRPNERQYTDIEKKIIIKAYEGNYSLAVVSNRLHTSPRKMKVFYQEYLRNKK